MIERSWTDDQLSAFLDGELPASDMEALSRDLETDAALAARMERLGSANTAYLNAIGEIDGAPMKAGLKAAMEAPPTAKVLAFKPRSVGAFLREHRAIAASLLCAAAVWGVASTTMSPGAGDPLAPGANGEILASSPLYNMLESGRTGDVVTVSAGVSATPRLTFAAADGGFCRQFDVVQDSGASAAIACRDGGGWRTQVVAYGLTRPSGDFQTASAVRSPALEAFLDQRMAGAPMNAEEEAKLLAEKWRSEK